MVLEWSPTPGKPFITIVKIYVPTSPPPPPPPTSPSPQSSPTTPPSPPPTTTPPSPRPICQRNLRAGWDEEAEAGRLDTSVPSHRLSQVRKTLKKKLFFFRTRSYAALRAADLDWIIGPEYSPGRYILGCSQRLASYPPALSSD